MTAGDKRSACVFLIDIKTLINMIFRSIRHTRMGHVCWSIALLTRHITPRLAAMLLQQAHIGDGHAPVHGFTHVVDGQQGDLHSGEGFHLHTGLPHRLNGGGALNAVAVGLQARRAGPIARAGPSLWH